MYQPADRQSTGESRDGGFGRRLSEVPDFVDSWGAQDHSRPAQLTPIHPLMPLKHLLSAAAMVLAASQVHAQDTTATIWSEFGPDSAEGTAASVSSPAGAPRAARPWPSTPPTATSMSRGRRASTRSTTRSTSSAGMARPGPRSGPGRRPAAASATRRLDSPRGRKSPCGRPTATSSSSGAEFDVVSLTSDIFAAGTTGRPGSDSGPTTVRISDISLGIDDNASGALNPQIILSDVFATAEMPIVAWRCRVRVGQGNAIYVKRWTGVAWVEMGTGSASPYPLPHQNVFNPGTGQWTLADFQNARGINADDSTLRIGCIRWGPRLVRTATRKWGTTTSDRPRRRASSRTTSAGRPWSSRMASSATASASTRTACTSAASSATTRCPPTWRREEVGRIESGQSSLGYTIADGNLGRVAGTAPPASTWRPPSIPRLPPSTARTFSACCNSSEPRGLRSVRMSPVVAGQRRRDPGPGARDSGRCRALTALTDFRFRQRLGKIGRRG